MDDKIKTKNNEIIHKIITGKNKKNYIVYDYFRLNDEKFHKNKLKITKLNIINIKITPANIDKLVFEILYLYLKGFRKFIIEYDFNKIKLPQSHIIKILNENLIKLVFLKKDIKVYLKNFIKCIVYNNFLKPSIYEKVKSNILIYEDFFLDENINNQFIKFEFCKECIYFKNCIGFKKEYKNIAKDEIEKPMEKNSKYYKKYLNYIEKNFQNEKIKNISKIIIDDFKKDKFHKRKIIVFVKSFPNNLTESSKERITYYIYNYKEDFKENFNLILNIININKKNLIEDFEKFIERSSLFTISASLMGNEKIRYSIYFTIKDLNFEQINELDKKIKNFNLKLIEQNKENNQKNKKKNNNLWGIGIDIVDDKISSIKVYNKYDKIEKNEILNFIENIDKENKKKTKNIINNIIEDENLTNVLLDKKYKTNKNKNLIIKRVDLSGFSNNINLKELTKILNLNGNFFEDKELYTLSFEVSNEKKEKINLYFSLK